MTRLKGKVKSISVKEVTEGMQVVFKVTNKICTVPHIITHLDLEKKYKIEQVEYLLNDLFGTTYGKAYLPGLKTLVVEYESILPNQVKQTLALLLKYSQWQSAIDDGLVDSSKEVKFEIKEYHIDELNPVEYLQAKVAQIVPQTKRMYSEEEMLYKLSELLTKHNVRQHLNINGFGYSQIERDIVSLFKQ